MSNKTINLTDSLYDYLLSVSLREPEVLKQLREETAQHERAQMQISPEQGQFMALLVKLLGAKYALEIGVFTGYSSLAVSLALPEDGKIIACDVSPDYTAIAQRYWKAAGVSHKIELHLGPAIKTLASLIRAGNFDHFDFAFIDADKQNYDYYYEHCLQLIRPGGLIAIDNVLWSGKVIDESAQDDDTKALRVLNRKLHADNRVDISLVPIADGLTLLRKK